MSTTPNSLARHSSALDRSLTLADTIINQIYLRRSNIPSASAEYLRQLFDVTRRRRRNSVAICRQGHTTGNGLRQLDVETILEVETRQRINHSRI